MAASSEPESVEVSVVMPCLNEADTRKAQLAMRGHGIVGEVIVADNGSSDGSQAIARRAGAHLVNVPLKGYGNAHMGGIDAARGRFVIMGDADDSYDFLEIPRIVDKLREGFSLVQGCRLPSGGGQIMPGATTFRLLRIERSGSGWEWSSGRERPRLVAVEVLLS